MIELERGGVAIGVGKLPMRKSTCVTVRRGSVIYAVAYCRNDQEAERLVDALCELTGAVRETNQEEGRTA